LESTSTTARPAAWIKEQPHTKAIVYFANQTDGRTFMAREKGKGGALIKDPRALGIWRLKKMVDDYHRGGYLKPLGAIIYDLQTGTELFRFKNGSWV
jgi:hypothetical protein